MLEAVPAIDRKLENGKVTMARRKENDDDDVSLFPFLSILSCVIGVLTLLITAMAISQMDTPEISETENFEDLKATDSKMTVKIKSLESRLQDSNQHAVELFQQQDKLTLLLDQLKKSEAEVKSAQEKVDPQFVKMDLDSKIKDLKAEKQQLDTEYATLEVELADRVDKKEGIVQVRPGGTGVDFQPTFVECRKEGLVLFKSDGTLHNILASQIGSDVVFLSTLDKLSDTPNSVMTFLLREDGVSTYYRARSIARSRYTKNGKLPVLGKGKLDLSLFMKKELP